MDYKEKNKAFLAYFWDLASDEAEKRLGASNGILEHVADSVKTQKGMNEEGTMTIDLDYTVKRLVRGLSSSRDSARHGFATCLSKLLSTKCVGAAAVLEIMEESTKITGKMKGSEERDLMFGKLFSYLALARSGLLEGEEAVSMEVMARLLELHKKRNWMREVVSEAILVVMWSMPPSLVEDKVLTLLANTDTDQVVGLGSYGTGTNLGLADTPLEEYTPWQLQLAIGLQLYASEHGEKHKSVKKLVRALAPGETRKVCTADTLPSLETTLLGATAGFPKVHRVWDYVLGQVFGMSGSDRSLPVQRVESLGSKQLSLLQGIITFIESQLMPASHERRSLAYRLTVTLVRLTPAEHMPLVLSPVVLRGLARARINKKHILNRLAARSIIDIVEAVQDDAKCRLLVASTLVQHGAGGGLHFDAFTQRMMTSLMEGLGADDVKTFIKSLAGIVANTHNQSEIASSSSSSAKKEVTPKKAGKKAGKKAPASASKKGDEEEEDDGEDEEEEETEEDLQLAAERAALAAIEALAALAKTSSLSHRSEAMVQIVSLFLRVGCFGAGQAKASGSTGSSSSSKGKRSGKKGGKNADADTVVALSDDCVAMFGIAEGSGKVSYPESVVTAAAGKLLAILSDAGNSTLAALDGDSNDSSTDSGPTLIMVTARMAFFLCSSCGVALHQKTLSSTAAVSGMVASMEQDEDGDNDVEDEHDDDGEGGEDSVKSVFLRAFAVMQSDALSVSPTKAASPAPTGKKGAKSADTNVHGWLHLLLGHASMMMLCAANEISATVSELSTVCPQVAALADGKAPAGDDDDEDEEEATAELLSGLLDATLELVSYSGDSAVTVKGIRESSRRVWGALGRSITITLPLLESVVEAVIGDDVEEEEEEDEADAHDDDSAAMDEEEEEASKGKGKGKGKAAKKDEEEEEEEEEDEIIGADEALDLLATEESDSEDELERLQGMVSETMHNEGADAALMSMLELRKQNRKAGLLLAKRKQCVIRSRALDILEALLVKADSAELLMPLLPPLLVCVRRLQSGLAQNLQEGQAFEERLRSFIETRLAKKHFVLLAEGDEEVEEGVVQLVMRVCDGLKIDLTCSSMPMRRMAQAVLLCVTRACAGSDVPAAQTVLAECVKSLLSLYFSKKNARLSSALFDEFVTRYPDFTVMHLMPLFVSAPAAEDTKGAFLRTEGVRYLSSTLRRFASLSEASKAQVGSSVAAICAALGTFLASLVGDGGDAGANAKRIKPVLQCVRELAQLPVCKGKIDELRNVGAATAANGKKGGKKSGKKEAAAAAVAGPSFDDAAAALVSAVEKAAAAGSSQQQQTNNTPTGKGSNAVSNVATQALTALGAMGLKVTMPAPATAASSSATTTPSKGDNPKPEGSSNKKQKKLTRLDEEELKYLKKQQQIMQEQEDEQEKQGNTAVVDAAAEAKLNKWFEEPAKQERRKKTKREQ